MARYEAIAILQLHVLGERALTISINAKHGYHSVFMLQSDKGRRLGICSSLGLLGSHTRLTVTASCQHRSDTSG